MLRKRKATKQDINVTVDKQSNFFYWMLYWVLLSTHLAKNVLLKKGHFRNWVILPKNVFYGLRTSITGRQVYMSLREQVCAG